MHSSSLSPIKDSCIPFPLDAPHQAERIFKFYLFLIPPFFFFFLIDNPTIYIMSSHYSLIAKPHEGRSFPFFPFSLLHLSLAFLSLFSPLHFAKHSIRAVKWNISLPNRMPLKISKNYPGVQTPPCSTISLKTF